MPKLRAFLYSFQLAGPIPSVAVVALMVFCGLVPTSQSHAAASSPLSPGSFCVTTIDNITLCGESESAVTFELDKDQSIPMEIGLQEKPDLTPQYNGKVFKVFNSNSLNAANAQAQPGDTIEIANGTYANFEIVISASGSDSKKVIVKPQSPRGVKLSGSSSLTLKANHLWVEGFHFEKTDKYALIVIGSHNRITQNYFRSCGTEGEETVRIFGTITNIEFDNNEISDSYRQSIVAYSPREGNSTFLKPQRHNIHHNYIHDIQGRVSNGAEVFTSIGGALLKDEYYENSFSFNLIINAKGDAEYMSVKNGGWKISYNRIVNSRGNLSLRESHNSIVEGNQIIDSGGIRIAGGNHKVINNYYSGADYALLLHHGYMLNGKENYAPAKNNLVAHNFFRTSKTPVMLLHKLAPLVFTEMVNNNTFVNNIFLKTTSGGWYTGGLTESFIEDNAWRSNIFWSDQRIYSSSDFPGSGGNRSTNPNVILIDGFYRPSASSSGLINSADGSYVSKDMFLFARDAMPDIGAIEFYE